MRSRSNSWNNTLAKLGFKRKRRKNLAKNGFARPLRMEGLEDRRMMANYSVSILADSGAGSLRQAISDANASTGVADIITFAVPGTITLTTGQLTITDNLTIVGPGADLLSINGGGLNRVFNVTHATNTLTVSISGLTITGGSVTGNNTGAGIYNSENLTLSHVNIVGNETGSNGSGGGIYSLGGNISIQSSTIDDNYAQVGGGAVILMDPGTIVDIANSTFSRNKALNSLTAPTTGRGGGLFISVISTANTTPAKIVNTTFSGNTSFAGGALRTQLNPKIDFVNNTVTNNHAEGAGSGTGGLHGHGNPTFKVHNSIIVGNTSVGNPTTIADAAGAFDGFSSYNLIGKTTNGTLNNTTTNHNVLLGTDPLNLAPLGDYGGPTETHPLLLGSRAIDRGSDLWATDFNLSQDQRGISRSIDSPTFNNPVSDIVDIGAVEMRLNPTADGIIEIYGTDSLDTILFTNTAVTLNGTPYNIDIAGAAKVFVYGLDGNDSINVDASVVTPLEIYGGDGNDTLYGGAGDDELFGGNGYDSLYGEVGNDRLDGGYDQSAADMESYLYGGAGDDTYVIRNMTDAGTGHRIWIDDVAGSDTLDFSNLTGLGVTVNLASSELFVFGELWATTTMGTQIENVIGTDFDDLITGNSFANRIEGGAGNDIVFGGDGNDTIEGGAGDDIVIGGSHNDTYVFSGTSGLGTDTIGEYTGEGSDTLDFSELLVGVGITVLLDWRISPHTIFTVDNQFLELDLYFAEIENVVGTHFNDNIRGNESNNFLYGNSGDDTLDGKGGNDNLFGGWGDDALEGGAGNDTLIGGAGNDTYKFAGSGSLGLDHLFEFLGEGTDTLDFSGMSARVDIDLEIENDQEVVTGLLSLANVLFSQEIENVIGTTYDDYIRGNILGNVLSGGNGNDELHGGSGNDTLLGEAGNDQLFGDAGDDTITGGLGSDSGVGGAGRDESDFSPGSGDQGAAPELEEVPTIQVRKGHQIVFRPKADDLDNRYEDLRFSLSGYGSNPLPISIANQTAIIINQYIAPGTYTAMLTVRDLNNNSSSMPITIQISDFNESPPAALGFVSLEINGEPVQQSDYIIEGNYVIEANIGPGVSGLPTQAFIEAQLRAGDSQTSIGDIVFRKVSGPGSIDTSGKFTWNSDYGDAGQTYKITYEIEDTGYPGSGVTFTTKANFYIRVKKYVYVGDSGHYIPYVGYNAPLAPDAEFSIPVDLPNSYYPLGARFNSYPEFPVRVNFSDPSHGSLSFGEDAVPPWHTYTPDPGYRGVDKFTYTIEHYAEFRNAETALPGWISTTGTITYFVGSPINIDIDSSLAEEVENQGLGQLLRWNNDDDNNNGIADYLEYSLTEEEDDFAEIQLEYSYLSSINPAPVAPALITLDGVRLWKTSDKSEEIHSGTRFLPGDLPSKLYVEMMRNGTASITMGVGSQTLQTSSDDNWYVGGVSDTIRFTSLFLDLDIDSDNNDGMGLPDRTDWEELLEDHDYGLGKLVMETEGSPEGPANWTPMILDIPNGSAAGVADLKVRFDWEFGSAGEIRLWLTEPDNLIHDLRDVADGGDRIYPSSEYTLLQLGIEDGGQLTVYVQGVNENDAIKTLKGVEDNGRPNEVIKATLSGKVNGVAQDLISDEVKYVVSQPDSFLYHLQTRQEVRNGLASRGVYDFSDMPKFSLKELSPEELLDLDVPGEVVALLGQGSGIPGFKATLYQDFIAGEDQYVLAFAGTDPTDINDWIANVWQGIGLTSEQYLAAMRIGDGLVNRTPGIQAGHLVATGHSLGGGLASAAYAASGMPAQTFNAAGLNFMTLLSEEAASYPDSIGNYFFSGSVDAYYMDWDLLSLVQDNTALPDALGTRIMKDGPYDEGIFFTSAAATAIIAIGFGSGFAWPVVWGTLGELGVGTGLLIQSHLIDSCLYGLLVTEDQFGFIVQDLLDYDL